MKKTVITTHLCFIIIVLFNLKVSAVAINSFLPKVGCPGTLVTVIGTDLDKPTAFSIGGKPAIILSNTGTKLVAMIMPGASSGNITITNAHGTAISKTNFMMVVTPVPGGPQGTKLLAKDTSGTAAQGTSVAFSSTGYIAIVGGSKDSSGTGAAWIYNYLGKQLNKKLVGSNFVGQSAQGSSVAISADGNTAIVGGPGDNNNAGAVWIFVRKDTTWKQQGQKLFITGTTGQIKLGSSVSLSADGNTLVAEAPGDNNNAGAAYVFTRKDTTWSQQSGRLVALGSAASITPLIADQKVALSADGDTFVMGAHTSANGMGSAWIFSRKNNSWGVQDTILFGTGAVHMPNQGSAVGISADGNIAAVGGYTDSTQNGAVWLFIRNPKNNKWSQMGHKLVASGSVGAAEQGCSVSLNADGKVLLFGGLMDDNNTGAAWVFTRTDTTWKQFLKLTGTGATNGSLAGNSVSLSADGIYSVIGGVGQKSGQGIAWTANTLGNGNGTPCQEPKTNTIAASSITSTSAILNGMVDATADLPTSVVFEYATLPDMSNSIVAQPTTGITPLYGISSSFTSTLTQLLPSTTYYFRIVAANFCTQVTYGNILQFTTPAEAPGSGLSEQSIPTAFSPNNDGINDKWDIPFLTKYPNCSVKISNRGGQVVFSSTGYSTSWDGKFKNTELPSGAYFYIIDLKNNKSSLSGSINLVK